MALKEWKVSSLWTLRDGCFIWSSKLVKVWEQDISPRCPSCWMTDVPFWFLLYENPLGGLGWFYCRNPSDLIALLGWWVVGCFSLVSSLVSHCTPLSAALVRFMRLNLFHRKMWLGFYSLMSVSQRIIQGFLKSDKTGCIGPLFSVHKLHWFFSNTNMPLNSESKASGLQAFHGNKCSDFWMSSRPCLMLDW